MFPPFGIIKLPHSCLFILLFHTVSVKSVGAGYFVSRKGGERSDTISKQSAPQVSLWSALFLPDIKFYCNPAIYFFLSLTGTFKASMACSAVIFMVSMRFPINSIEFS